MAKWYASVGDTENAAGGCSPLPAGCFFRAFFIRHPCVPAGGDYHPMMDRADAGAEKSDLKSYLRRCAGMKVVVVKSPRVLGCFLRFVFGIKKSPTQ